MIGRRIELPAGWERLQLQDVAEIVSGVAKGRKFNGAETVIVPYLRVANVQAGHLDLAEVKLIEVLPGDVEKCRLQPGDVLMTEGGDRDKLGRGTIWRGEVENCIHQNHVFRVRANQSRLLPEYLNLYLGTPEAKSYFLRAAKQTTGIASINRTQLSGFPVALPPVTLQRRITAIFDKADAIRRKREEGIRLTEELLRSTFLAMFGDGTSNSIRPLAEVAAIASGVTKGRKLNGNVMTVPYLRVANVQDGFLNLDEIKTIEAMPEEVESLALQRGDIVMTEGGDHDKLGRGAIWNQDIPNCIHQNHVFRVRVDRATVLPEYFAAFLQTAQAKSYFLRCAKKTTNLATINMTQLKALPVPVPPIELQRKFERVADAVSGMRNTRKRASTEADQLFGSLVQRAFRGEL